MIGILTYDVPHRKTYDTLCLLKAKGYSKVIVFAKSLHYKKRYRPLYEHRPQIINNLHSVDICKNFNFTYVKGEVTEGLLPKNSIILVCGAGIIKDSIVEKYKIINAHPGYIPDVRGLDAFKWAVYEKQPIGVTTHIIGNVVDAGFVIERKLVPIYQKDTFHAVAQRVYEKEILMLVEAIERIDQANLYIEPGNFELHKRMPNNIEVALLEKFEELKMQLCGE